MSDNTQLGPGTGGDMMATDEVPYSGDLAKVQLVRVVSVSGTEGSKTVGADLASVVKAEDSASANGDMGVVMLMQRRDSDATAVDTDGDYATLKGDEEGRLKVSTKPASYPDVTGDITAIQATINTPVAGGTVTADVSRASNVMMFCTNTFAGVNVSFEGSLESSGDTSWFGVQAVRTNANTIETTTGALSAVPAYAWELSVNGLARVRVRCTARTSGTQSWRIKLGSYATEPIPAAQVSATQPISGTVTATGVAGAAAEDAAASGNPVLVGGVVRTANAPTTLVAGDVARLSMTSGGATVIKQYAPAQTEWNANLALTTTSNVAVAAAAAAGIRNHITSFWAINTGAAAVDVILLDGTNERARYILPINVPVPVTFPTGLLTTAATALNAALSAAGTVRFVATGYTAP